MLSPKVGTSEFKRLDFKDQLELVSLKLFDNQNYLRRVGKSVRPSNGLPDSYAVKDLAYPPNVEIGVHDLPVSFLRDYWAGYACSYSERWYLRASGGATPLDEYDIKVGYMENLRTFTFPMVSVLPSIFFIASWVSRAYFKGEMDADTLLDSCKVWVWLSQNDRLWDGLEDDEAVEVYRRAMTEYQEFLLFEDLNGHFPIVEECDELLYLEGEEFVVFPIPQPAADRYFYPMIPGGLYVTQKFSVRYWGWVDKLEDKTENGLLSDPRR